MRAEISQELDFVYYTHGKKFLSRKEAQRYLDKVEKEKELYAFNRRCEGEVKRDRT